MELREMSDDACITFLASHTFGHLASMGEQYPYVVPVHYAYDSRKVFLFSMPGQKVDQLRIIPFACLQVEEMEKDRMWKSVLVQGRFDELPDIPARRNERLHAWSLLEKRPFWWEPGSFELSAGEDGDSGSPIFFSLSIDVISGRQVEHRA
ncbi:pyridoxamine 5'-phosphate oxidase family protein [Rhizobium sp. MC63]|uniref:Pyridoxamine 5'-phosphate oxidase family protein n=1 Tax=Rhizobium mulingense TaxID=3031128 RepID=A0ACC6MWJ9_9HYPH|nr:MULTISPECIES: pyridoxamine 5'-phosphate oxidase family protein [unclassified Rhizobium]MDF0694919.1 pyridoxamine 5'-phosphate oxidase family protein [Rhizobium sp. MC63]MEA3517716.1 pyridoxamine 5'-phosphate oxidase family protein [Rhizobium sp. MJ31]